MKIIRTLLAGFAIAVVSVACTKEPLQTSSTNQTSITVSLAEPASKTSIEGWKTYWDKGDEISVFVTRQSNGGGSWPWGAGSQYSHSKFTFKEGISFTGSLDSKFSAPYNWFALYPAGSYGSTSNSISVTVNHPKVQTQKGNNNSHICGANTPLYGFAFDKKENPSIQMHQVASVLVFKINNGTDSNISVTGIKFTAPAEITGDFTTTIDLKEMTEERVPQWSAGASSSKDVTLQVSGTGSIPAGSSGEFYAAIHPIDATGNYTIEVTAESGGKTLTSSKTGKYTFSISAGMYRTVLYTFANPKEPESVKIETCIENDALKAYLDRVENKPYFTNDTFMPWNSTNYGSTHMTGYSGNSKNNRLDHPKPVTISWSGTATDVSVYIDKEKKSKVPNEVIKSSEKAEIYNLIPGKTYWYTISNDAKILYEGDFTPTGRRRMMRVSTNFKKENAANCRDYGGLETVDGHHIRYGLIYRGTNLDNFKNDEGMRDVLLKVMGIKLDIDLRDNTQAKGAQDLKSYGISSDYQDYTYKDLSDLTNRNKVTKTLTKIMNSVLNDEPVYLHCSIGSDRTGYFSAMIEALLGVRQNWTDTDYELTSFSSSITDGPRLRTDHTSSTNCKYKNALEFFADFQGETFSDKVYDYVVTSTKSNALKMDKETVDAFIKKMTE